MWAYWDWGSLILYICSGMICCYACTRVKKRELRTGKKQNILCAEYMVWYAVWLFLAVFRHIERGIGGTDAYNYMTYFDVCLDLNSQHRYVKHVDSLYRLLNQFIRLFTDNYHVLFFIIYTIIIFSYILVINEFAIPECSLLPVAILFYMYLRGFNTIRTTLSVSIILFSMVALKKRRNVLAMVLAVSSVFIHKVSMLYICYLILYYMYKKNKLTVKGCLVYTGIVAFVGPIARDVLIYSNWRFLNTGAYISYMSRSLVNSFFDGFWKICFSQLLLGAALIIFNKGLNQYILNLKEPYQTDAKFVRLVCYFDIMTIPATYLLGIWRGYEYFYLLRLLMWGMIIHVICTYFTKQSRRVIEWAFLIAFMVWMVSRIESTWESSSLMPYVLDFWGHSIII